MRLALLTYSTKLRGGVAHTLNLAEALAAQGVEVTVWSLARRGDRGFFRDVDSSVAVWLVDFPEWDAETVTAGIVRSIDLLGTAFAADTRDPYGIGHAQDCVSVNAVDTCIRTIHHLDEFITPVLADCHENAVVRPYARICVSAAVAAEVAAGWGLNPTVIPNGVQAQCFAAAAADCDCPTSDWSSPVARPCSTIGTTGRHSNVVASNSTSRRRSSERWRTPTCPVSPRAGPWWPGTCRCCGRCSATRSPTRRRPRSSPLRWRQR